MTTLTRKQCKELFVRGDNIEQRKWNDFIDTMFSSVDSASWTLVGTEDFTITSTATTTTVFSLTANSLTTGTAMLLTSSGTITTTGEILNVVGNSATTCTGLIRGSGTALTDGWVAQLTGGGANITASGGVLDIVCGASTLGSGIRITSTGIGTSTTVGQLLHLVADSTTTGTGVYGTFDGLTTGAGVSINTSSTGLTTAGNLVYIGASGDFNDAGGQVVEIESAHTTGTGVQLTMDAITDGTGLAATFDALTIGYGLSLTHTTGIIAGGGSMLNISSTSVDTSNTTGTLLNLSAANQAAGVVAYILANGALTGDVLRISANNQTTGNLIYLDGGGNNMQAGSSLASLDMTGATLGFGLEIFSTGTFYTGAGLINVTTTAVSTGTGLAILMDTNLDANGAQAIVVSKDITGELTADIASSGNAVSFRVDNTNTSSTDFDMSTTGNAMVIGLSHTSNTTNAKTDTEAFTARALYIDVDATTTNANDKVTRGTNGAFLIDYTLTQTAGDLDLTAHSVASIEVNLSGAIDFATGAYNLMNVSSADSVSCDYVAGAVLSGFNADLSGMTVTDADLALYGLHITMPTAAGSTVAHIHSTGTLITSMSTIPTIGSGFGNAAVADWICYGQFGAGGAFYSEVILDLTGLVNSTTADDIIGDSTEANCHFGQISAAVHGTIFHMEIECLEVPAGGDLDIDFWSATEGTGTENTLITDLDETIVYARGGNWGAGDKFTVTNFPATTKYMYLAVGSAGGAPGTYSGGKFIIRIWGT